MNSKRQQEWPGHQVQWIQRIFTSISLSLYSSATGKEQCSYDELSSLAIVSRMRDEFVGYGLKREERKANVDLEPMTRIYMHVALEISQVPSPTCLRPEGACIN